MGLKDKLMQRGKQAGLVQDDAAAQEAAQAEQQEYVDSMWHWVRTTLDEACDRYQHEGNPDLLHECLASPALERVIGFLDEMRANNRVWTFQREQRNHFQVAINDIIDDTYVITEYFNDYSRVECYQGGQLLEVIDGDGRPKVIKAVVQVSADTPKISRIELISDAT